MLIGSRTALWSGGAKPWVNPYITDGLMIMFDGMAPNEDGTPKNIGTFDMPMQWTNVQCKNGLIEIGPSGWGLGTRLTTNFADWDGVTMSLILVNGWDVEIDTVNVNFGWGYWGDPYFKYKYNKRFSIGSGDGYGHLNVQIPNKSISLGVKTVNSKSYMTLTAGDGKLSIIRDNVVFVQENAFNHKYTTDAGFCIKGMGSPPNDTITRTIGNIRVYNRKLSDAELAANYAVDKARFGLT